MKTYRVTLAASVTEFHTYIDAENKDDLMKKLEEIYQGHFSITYEEVK